MLARDYDNYAWEEREYQEVAQSQPQQEQQKKIKIQLCVSALTKMVWKYRLNLMLKITVKQGHYILPFSVAT